MNVKYYNKPFFVAFRGIARHCNYLGDLLLALISYRTRRPCCIVIVDRDDHAELNGKFFCTLFFDIQFWIEVASISSFDAALWSNLVRAGAAGQGPERDVPGGGRRGGAHGGRPSTTAPTPSRSSYLQFLLLPLPSIPLTEMWCGFLPWMSSCRRMDVGRPTMDEQQQHPHGEPLHPFVPLCFLWC